MKLDFYRIILLWGLPFSTLVFSYFLLRKLNNRGKYIFIIAALILVSLNIFHWYELEFSKIEMKSGMSHNFGFFLKVNLEALIIGVLVLIYWGINRNKKP